ncbi:MAG: peptidoglycan DD-metalloendopeptidase family protein [Ardenticatenia bacterium]|nr:peptidoglycan DD-metalloendopeptidase family protein [Ardenticatenia bacterium]
MRFVTWLIVVLWAGISALALASLSTMPLFAQSPAERPRLSLPFPAGQTYTVSCGYTCYQHRETMAYAVDFAMPADTPVVAAADGVVLAITWEPGLPADKHLGDALIVYVDHGGGWFTRYVHLGGITVRVGQRVRRGEIIGYVGATGAERAHLHFELKHGTTLHVPSQPVDDLFGGQPPQEGHAYTSTAEPPPPSPPSAPGRRATPPPTPAVSSPLALETDVRLSATCSTGWRGSDRHVHAAQHRRGATHLGPRRPRGPGTGRARRARHPLDSTGNPPGAGRPLPVLGPAGLHIGGYLLPAPLCLRPGFSAPAHSPRRGSLHPARDRKPRPLLAPDHPIRPPISAFGPLRAIILQSLRVPNKSRMPMNSRQTPVILALSGLAFWLQVTRLHVQSLWYDEGFSAWLASRPAAEIVARTAADIHPPLYYLLLHAWTALAGSSEFSLRFLSVMAGVPAVPLVWVLSRGLLGRQAGPVAALLAAIAPVWLWYAQEARMYTLVTTLGLTSTWALIRLLERPLPPARGPLRGNTHLGRLHAVLRLVPRNRPCPRRRAHRVETGAGRLEGLADARGRVGSHDRGLPPLGAIRRPPPGRGPLLLERHTPDGAGDHFPARLLECGPNSAGVAG